jgi:hypothetical protein
MKSEVCAFLLFLTFIFTFVFSSFAQMQSDNYSIPSSVQSSGGTPMTSDNYKAEATFGQPSPLMDTDDPPYSASYDLYPGFWYTMAASPAGCEDLLSFAGIYGSVSSDPNYSSSCDTDVDSDVDGSDLAEFASGFE